MRDQFIFGYGSLVNRATHGYGEPTAARLTGWKRIWRHTELRPLAYLTVEPDAATAIDGLIVQVAHDDAELGAREHAYDRSDVTPQVRHARPEALRIHVFAIAEGRHGRPTEAHPVLLSYIDTVAQGFLREYGTAGVAHFFATTDGWDAPVLDDRAAPVYSRAQRLTAEETAMVDDGLSALRVRRIRP